MRGPLDSGPALPETSFGDGGFIGPPDLPQSPSLRIGSLDSLPPTPPTRGMSFSTLALPASDRGWILCSGGAEIAREPDLRDLAGTRGDLLVALPATCVSTFVVELPPVEEALHETMIRAQADKRGLSGKGAALVDFERVDHSERRDVFAVRVVPDLPGDLVVPTAAAYTFSASLHASSSLSGAATATVWREQGRLVLGVFVGGVTVHIQVLNGKPEVAAPLAGEIHLILMGLKGESLFEHAAPGEVILSLEGVGGDELAAFRAALSLPVRLDPPRPPAKGEGRDRLLPAAVTALRKRRRSVARNFALLAAGLVIYAVVGMGIWTQSKATQREIDSLERRIAIIQPDVERIQLAEQRWRSLEPAFNKDLFPIVQLSRITAALPGSGVVVREYRTTGRGIRVRGQARDVQLANRLLEDLQGMDGFESYDWLMPNPKVERNNTATFEIEGKPKHEG